ncbi:unnamed protein product [Cercospora beticola]|nr:unnamed protein product [Cercospora beticola]
MADDLTLMVFFTKLETVDIAVLLKNAVAAELGEFQGKALVLPLHEGPFTMFPLLEHFFNDSWNAQRLSKLLEHGCSLEQGSELLAWQLTVCRYAHILDSTLLAEEYLLADLDTVEALDRIKGYRKIVARLRRHLASSATAVNRRTLQSVYDTAASREDHHDAAVTVGIQRSGSSLSPRQLASSTFEEEYNWLENKTIHVMASLNESLQLIIASVNLRQSSIALEDSRNSRQNGERATLLTLLAAIYLPLTLATGIFGMNIKEISEDGKGPSWHAVAAMAGALLGISVGFIIIFWLWPRGKKCSDLEGRAEAENPPFPIDNSDLEPFRRRVTQKRENERPRLPSRGHFKVRSKKSKHP